MPKYTVGVCYTITPVAGTTYWKCVSDVESVWHQNDDVFNPGCGTYPNASRVTFQAIVNATTPEKAIDYVCDAAEKACGEIRDQFGHMVDLAARTVTVDHGANA